MPVAEEDEECDLMRVYFPLTGVTAPGLQASGLMTDPGKIVVDERCRTNGVRSGGMCLWRLPAAKDGFLDKSCFIKS